MENAGSVNKLIDEIKRLSAQKGATTVSSVRVIVGALCAIEPEDFRDQFEAAAEGTVAEGAELEVVLNPEANEPKAEEIVIDNIEFNA